MITNTYNGSAHSSRLTFTLGVISLLAGMLGAGCGGPFEEAALGQQEAPMQIMGGCTSGTCSDPNNTFGIYVSNGLGYCIPVGSQRFCPEHFLTLPASREVFLRGQKVSLTGPWPSSPEYLSFKVQGKAVKSRLIVPVSVESVTTNADGALQIQVNDGTSQWTISGSGLQGLTLSVTWDTTPINLKIGSATPEAQGDNLFWTYSATYQVPSVSDVWRSTCDDGSGKAAFLSQRIVHGRTAQLTTYPAEAPAVTMACVSGAIGGCMAWGYRPWEADSAQQQAADTLYGACLQAKRAAYFAQFGDYNSYTVAGTPLSVQDQQAIMPVSPMPGVEALWTPGGPTCFSPKYRRVAVSPAILPPLPSGGSYPLECTEPQHAAARLGALQSQSVLTPSTPLATGPAQ